MTTATLNPKVTDPIEHERRLRETQLRVTAETCEWVRTRREILSASFLAVATVRERAEHVAGIVWNTEGLTHEQCAQLTEAIFAIAAPPSRRLVEIERGMIPMDPLRVVGDGITLGTPTPSPDEREDDETASETCDA